MYHHQRRIQELSLGGGGEDCKSRNFGRRAPKSTNCQFSLIFTHFPTLYNTSTNYDHGLQKSGGEQWLPVPLLPPPP